jgi:RNA polymerase sigma factor (sigma-70 family)
MNSKHPARQPARDSKNTPVLEAFIVYEKAIKRFVGRFLVQPNDIEDVSQEAFLKAYAAEQDKPIEQPKSFLFRIAKHLAISQLRQNVRHPSNSMEDFDCSDVIPEEWSAEDEVAAHQKLGIRCEAVAELSPQVRRVYLMRKVYGMSHKEIAERLGIARSTVEKHLIKGVMLCERYVRERVAEKPAKPASGAAMKKVLPVRIHSAKEAENG